MNLFRLLLSGVFIGSATASLAGPMLFDGSWREQGFFRFWTNRYVQSGAVLDVVSDGTVSLLWRPVDEDERAAHRASWTWAVAEGVAGTDLSQRGGDDRNLALYFVFTDAETAGRISPRSARRLMRKDTTRVLVYVWGGVHAPGTVLPSPYHPALRTVVKRPAGLGEFAETVDLRDDYRRIFGEAPGVLVGVGVTADSDDTGGRIRARIRDLELE